MGYGSYSNDAYKSISTPRATAPTATIFTSSKIHKNLDPNGLKVRESRDSALHPESIAIIVALDETGSMGEIPGILARGKLGTLMSVLIAHGVPHPQILPMGIGDDRSDRSPCQVGQFESAAEELDSSLTSIYLEGNGGGQHFESYGLAHLVAARHTSIDCYEKRGQKGFLFTIGDEAPWDHYSADKLAKIFGYTQPENLTLEQILVEAMRTYHVFHIHVQQGTYRDSPMVLDPWRKLLGERLLILDDYDNTAELIATTVAVVSGADLAAVTKTLSAAASHSVTTALATLGASLPARTGDTGMITL